MAFMHCSDTTLVCSPRIYLDGSHPNYIKRLTGLLVHEIDEFAAAINSKNLFQAVNSDCCFVRLIFFSLQSQISAHA